MLLCFPALSSSSQILLSFQLLDNKLCYNLNFPLMHPKGFNFDDDEGILDYIKCFSVFLIHIIFDRSVFNFNRVSEKAESYLYL